MKHSPFTFCVSRTLSAVPLWKGVPLAVGIVVLLLFASCGTKEGALRTKTKISQITSVENHYADGTLFYTTGSYLEQDWKWDDKEVYRIDYHGGEHPYSENFFYDNRHRIVRTTVPAYYIRTELFYDGRKLEHIEVYDNDELYCYMTFVHEGRDLVEISCNYYPVSDTSNPVLDKVANPLAPLLGDDAAQSLESGVRCKGAGRKGASVRYLIEWTEDNPTHITCIDAEGSKDIYIAYTYYDNPYFQLYGFREMNNPLFRFGMLPRNAVDRIVMPFGRSKNQQFFYYYQYVDDVVSECRMKYSYSAVVGSDFDSVMYSVEKVQHFTYLDQ